MLEYESTSSLIDHKRILTTTTSSTSSPLMMTPDGMMVNNHPSTTAPSLTSSFSTSASSSTLLRPPVRRIAPHLNSTPEDKISPSQLDPAAIGSNGFVPLTRRWTFASDAATERVKAASCGDISDMMMSSTSSSSTTTSSLSSTKTTCTISTRASPSPSSPSITPVPQKVDMKRELHRASLANEMCQSVAQLIMSSKKVMAKADRDHALLLAAEATRKHLARFPPRYSLSVETRDVLIHMALIDEAVKTGHPAVYVQQDLSGGPNSTIQPGDRRWVVTMSCKDRPHLLDTFTCMLSEHVTKIIDADAMTSRDGMALDRFTIEGHEELTARMLTRGMEQMLRLADRAPHNRSPLGPDYNEAFPYLSNSSLLEEEEEKAEENTVITNNSNRRQLQSEGDIDDEEEVMYTSPAWSPESSFVSEEEVDKEEQEEQQQVNRQQQHQHQQQHDEQIGLGLEDEDRSSLSTNLPTLKTIPFSDITLGCLIAQSRSCEMYQAQLHRTIERTKAEGTGRVDEEKEVIVVAAKVITHQANTQRGLYELNREIEIVRQLQHPNICQFYGVANAFGSRSYCLLYEYLERGSLSDLLRDKHRSYDFFRLATEIACGMAYLHKEGVLHRDLKSSNILMDGQGRAKIIDFGLSCMVQPTGQDLTAETGTYRWMAPEVIRHEPYSTAADVYSYGIVLWEMVTRDQPFRGLTPIQAAFSVARRNERPTLPDRLPLRLSALIRRCWHQEPLRRPSFSEILRILPEVHGEV